MFLIRQARPGDLRQLLKLARELDSINLPTESSELRALLERSARSFAGRIRQRSRAVYLFCAEAAGTGAIAGASMIIGKHGTPRSPHYYLQVDSDERYSHALRKMFRHTHLRLRYSMDGPSELGGLIVKRAMRRNPERVGRQLSWVRFLYIAKHRARFERELIAETAAADDARLSQRFLGSLGRPASPGSRFARRTGFRARDKQFIRELFPESPLYTFLLPEDGSRFARRGRRPDSRRGEIARTGRDAVSRSNRSIRRRSLLRRRGWRPGAGQELPQLSDNARRGIAGGAEETFLVAREDRRGFRAAKAAALAEARTPGRRAGDPEDAGRCGRRSRRRGPAAVTHGRGHPDRNCAMVFDRIG